MPAKLALKCDRCGGDEFEHVIKPGPNDPAVCVRCRRQAAYDELLKAADVRLGNEVDIALARRRDVNRRFLNR